MRGGAVQIFSLLSQFPPVEFGSSLLHSGQNRPMDPVGQSGNSFGQPGSLFEYELHEFLNRSKQRKHP
jgi:hypothetical protein